MQLKPHSVSKVFNCLGDAVDAYMRLDSFAPIQHMTDVGMFMHKSAQQRYERFAYVNNLLYESFEKTASKIKTPCSSGYFSERDRKICARNSSGRLVLRKGRNLH